jgi:hypothetical protein
VIARESIPPSAALGSVPGTVCGRMSSLSSVFHGAAHEGWRLVLRLAMLLVVMLVVIMAAGVGGDAAGAAPAVEGDEGEGEGEPAGLADGEANDGPAEPSEGDDATADGLLADPPAATDPAEPELLDPAPAAEPSDAGSADGAPKAALADAGPPAALPSGQAKTDDEPVDEAQRAEDRRAGRRRRERGRDEGQWQVFEPYPELGPIRYRDPERRRTLWLGVDASGTYLPASLGLSDRATWTLRPAGAWAFALTPWLALGGRHELAWYDSGDQRIRVQGNQVELSSRPLAATRSNDALDDRLAVGVTTHALRWSDQGLQDTIVSLGYGLDHLLGSRWRLGWHAQGRYAWVGHDTQRQVRLSTRLAFNPRPAHRLTLEAVGYYVNRDALVDPPRPRHSGYGQFGIGYAWVGRAGLGPWTNVRATTGFLSGEAPLYELREEALEAAYGEVLVGMLARWP